MNNIISLMIGMKPKDAIKLDTFPLDKNIQKKLYYLEMAYTDIFINLGNNMEIKKDRQQTLSGVKIN